MSLHLSKAAPPSLPLSEHQERLFDKLCRNCWEGNAGKVQQLLPEVAEVLEHKDKKSSGYTPLHYAAYAGHVEVLSILLSAGCNSNVLNDEGCTPLFLSVQQGHCDAAGLLLDFGADCWIAEPKRGWTACALIETAEMRQVFARVGLRSPDKLLLAPQCKKADSLAVLRMLLDKEGRANGQLYQARGPVHASQGAQQSQQASKALSLKSELEILYEAAAASELLGLQLNWKHQQYTAGSLGTIKAPSSTSAAQLSPLHSSSQILRYEYALLRVTGQGHRKQAQHGGKGPAEGRKQAEPLVPELQLVFRGFLDPPAFQQDLLHKEDRKQGRQQQRDPPTAAEAALAAMVKAASAAPGEAGTGKGFSASSSYAGSASIWPSELSILFLAASGTPDGKAAASLQAPLSTFVLPSTDGSGTLTTVLCLPQILLQPGYHYCCKVRGHNVFGAGAWSEASSPFTALEEAPAAPLLLQLKSSAPAATGAATAAAEEQEQQRKGRSSTCCSVVASFRPALPLLPISSSSPSSSQSADAHSSLQTVYTLLGLPVTSSVRKALLQGLDAGQLRKEGGPIVAASHSTVKGKKSLHSLQQLCREHPLQASAAAKAAELCLAAWGQCGSLTAASLVSAEAAGGPLRPSLANPSSAASVQGSLMSFPSGPATFVPSLAGALEEEEEDEEEEGEEEEDALARAARAAAGLVEEGCPSYPSPAFLSLLRRFKWRVLAISEVEEEEEKKRKEEVGQLPGQQEGHALRQQQQQLGTVKREFVKGEGETQATAASIPDQAAEGTPSEAASAGTAASEAPHSFTAVSANDSSGSFGSSPGVALAAPAAVSRPAPAAAHMESALAAFPRGTVNIRAMLEHATAAQAASSPSSAPSAPQLYGTFSIPSMDSAKMFGSWPPPEDLLVCLLAITAAGPSRPSALLPLKLWRADRDGAAAEVSHCQAAAEFQQSLLQQQQQLAASSSGRSRSAPSAGAARAGGAADGTGHMSLWQAYSSRFGEVGQAGEGRQAPQQQQQQQQQHGGRGHGAAAVGGLSSPLKPASTTRSASAGAAAGAGAHLQPPASPAVQPKAAARGDGGGASSARRLWTGTARESAPLSSKPGSRPSAFEREAQSADGGSAAAAASGRPSSAYAAAEGNSKYSHLPAAARKAWEALDAETAKADQIFGRGKGHGGQQQGGKAAASGGAAAGGATAGGAAAGSSPSKRSASAEPSSSARAAKSTGSSKKDWGYNAEAATFAGASTASDRMASLVETMLRRKRELDVKKEAQEREQAEKERKEAEEAEKQKKEWPLAADRKKKKAAEEEQRAPQQTRAVSAPSPQKGKDAGRGSSRGAAAGIAGRGGKAAGTAISPMARRATSPSPASPRAGERKPLSSPSSKKATTSASKEQQAAAAASASATPAAASSSPQSPTTQIRSRRAAFEGKLEEALAAVGAAEEREAGAREPRSSSSTTTLNRAASKDKQASSSHASSSSSSSRGRLTARAHASGEGKLSDSRSRTPAARSRSRVSEGGKVAEEGKMAEGDGRAGQLASHGPISSAGDTQLGSTARTAGGGPSAPKGDIILSTSRHVQAEGPREQSRILLDEESGLPLSVHLFKQQLEQERQRDWRTDWASRSLISRSPGGSPRMQTGKTKPSSSASSSMGAASSSMGATSSAGDRNAAAAGTGGPAQPEQGAQKGILRTKSPLDRSLGSTAGRRARTTVRFDGTAGTVTVQPLGEGEGEGHSREQGMQGGKQVESSEEQQQQQQRQNQTNAAADSSPGLTFSESSKLADDGAGSSTASQTHHAPSSPSRKPHVISRLRSPLRLQQEPTVGGPFPHLSSHTSQNTAAHPTQQTAEEVDPETGERRLVQLSLGTGKLKELEGFLRDDWKAPKGKNSATASIAALQRLRKQQEQTEHAIRTGTVDLSEDFSPSPGRLLAAGATTTDANRGTGRSPGRGGSAGLGGSFGSSTAFSTRPGSAGTGRGGGTAEGATTASSLFGSSTRSRAGFSTGSLSPSPTRRAAPRAAAADWRTAALDPFDAAANSFYQPRPFSPVSKLQMLQQEEVFLDGEVERDEREGDGWLQTESKAGELQEERGWEDSRRPGAAEAASRRAAGRADGKASAGDSRPVSARAAAAQLSQQYAGAPLRELGMVRGTSLSTSSSRRGKGRGPSPAALSFSRALLAGPSNSSSAANSGWLLSGGTAELSLQDREAFAEEVQDELLSGRAGHGRAAAGSRGHHSSLALTDAGGSRMHGQHGHPTRRGSEQSFAGWRKDSIASTATATFLAGGGGGGGIGEGLSAAATPADTAFLRGLSPAAAAGTGESYSRPPSSTSSTPFQVNRLGASSREALKALAAAAAAAEEGQA